MKKGIKLTLMLATVLTTVLASGCVRRTGDLTVISSHTLATYVDKAEKRDSAATCQHWALFGLIPFGGKNYELAVEEVLNRYPTYDALVDVTTYDREWGVLLYGQDCWVIEGTPAKIGRGATPTSAAPASPAAPPTPPAVPGAGK